MQGIWYDLADMVYHEPGANGMVYRMAGIVWYGMAGITWSMIWPGRHGMVYGMV